MHPREFFWILTPSSSLSRVSDSLGGGGGGGASNFQKLEKENICPDHFPDFNLESSIIIKNKFLMKNLTDFRKTVETDVDPGLR